MCLSLLITIRAGTIYADEVDPVIDLGTFEMQVSDNGSSGGGTGSGNDSGTESGNSSGSESGNDSGEKEPENMI